MYIALSLWYDDTINANERNVMYTVTKNITGKLSIGTPAEESVDINYYSGDSLAQALAAFAVASAEVERTDTLYRVNDVRLVVNS